MFFSSTIPLLGFARVLLANEAVHNKVVDFIILLRIALPNVLIPMHRSPVFILLWTDVVAFCRFCLFKNKYGEKSQRKIKSRHVFVLPDKNSS